MTFSQMTARGIGLRRVASKVKEISAEDFLRELAQSAEGDLRRHLEKVADDVEEISDPSVDLVQVLTRELAHANPNPAD